MKKLLFITSFFPPLGGAGVQRAVKFVKYLPDFGILPIVLTGTESVGGRWTPEDRSMLSEIPQSIPVLRLPSEQSFFARLSEKQRIVSRREEMIRMGDLAVQQYRPNAILVTMSPFDDSIVASNLSAKHKLPWIADLRDPWALDEFQVYSTFWERKRELVRMERSLTSAACIIMNTPEAANRLRSVFPKLAPKVSTAITNGYDAEEFPKDLDAVRNEKFTIVHSGYFHAELGLCQRRRALEYRLLGRIEKGVDFLPRSHFYLIQALQNWRQIEPNIFERVRVICLGSPSQIDLDLVNNSSVKDLFCFTGYIPHTQCIKSVRSADLLFLPLHKVAKGSRATIVPGKTYEYMASGRPILAALPEGDARDFISLAGSGYLCKPDDVTAMQKILQTRYLEWSTDRITSNWNKSFVSKFERRLITKRLAGEINRVISASPKE